MKLRNNLILFTAFIFSINLSAQDTGNSPYSSIGIGDINYQGDTRNIGMGNTGISNSNFEFINNLNPALLPVNKFLNRDTTVKYTMLEGGFVGDYYKQSTNKASQTNGGFNLQYINFAFPVSKNWTTSIGLRPYSNVSHRVNTTGKIGDSLYYLSEDKYNGGLNQVHFANGFDVTKNLSIGLFAGYIFGNINQEKTIQTYALNYYTERSGFQSKNIYSGFQLKPGVAYRIQLKDSSGAGNGIFLNAGFVYEKFLGMKVEANRDLIYKDEYEKISIYNPALSATSKLNATFPTTISGGLSINKPDRWTIAMDFNQSQWKEFQSPQELSPDMTLNNTFSLGIGGELKPAKNLSLTSKEYRAGFFYSTLPYTFNGKQLDDISVSFGTSLPFGRKDARYKSKPLTKVNAALVIGTRGTRDYGLVKEQYFKLFISAIIQDKWFQRWKID